MEIVNSSSLLKKKNKSYGKILGELHNKHKQEKENKKQLSVQSRVKR